MILLIESCDNKTAENYFTFAAFYPHLLRTSLT